MRTQFSEPVSGKTEFMGAYISHWLFNFITLIIFYVLGLSSCLFAMEWDGELALRGQKHAPESGLSVLGKFQTSLKTKQSILGFNKKRFQLQLEGFYEPGVFGDSSMDIDQLAYRIEIPKRAYFFIGRTHPALEGNHQKEAILPQSALGSLWTQNQTMALDPKVRGWIGGGVHFNLPSSTRVTLFYSPLFVPHLGTRLTLSETQNAKGSRYARLPPQSIRVNNQVLPLRYDLQTGSLWDILLQDQYFSSIRHRKNGLDLSLFFFSAPSPEPEIDTSGILKVTDSDIMALATVKPRFERENHLGFKSNFYQLYSKPDCEFFYETRSKNFTLSIMNEPLSFLKLGFLNKWKNKKLDPATSSITVASYAEMLVWFELLWKKDKKEHSFEPSLRVEHHLAAQKKGSLISPKLQYWINNNFLIYSQVHILMGHALSYYGNWRSLDSINMGLKFLW